MVSVPKTPLVRNLIKGRLFSFFIVFLSIYTIPYIVSAETTDVTLGKTSTETPVSSVSATTTALEALVNKIIELHTRTSSTSTVPVGPGEIDPGFKELPLIETSTTTLSIEAPLIKLWQSAGGITSNLSQGSKNNQVVMLQGALKAFVPGYKAEYISGYFGPKTATALKIFQKDNNITQTGTVGMKTRELINRKYLNDFCPKKEGTTELLENLDRTQSIPSNYVPSDLTVLQKPIRTAGIVCLTNDAAMRLGLMFADAKKAGFDLIVLSGYRRYEIQELLRSWSSDNNITDPTEAIGLAEAGHSEHQLGTTVDISGKTLNYSGPDTSFGKTPEGKWLQQNSYKYGFIMSYPKDKEKLTGYIYEPWHFRYIGVDNATDIHNDNTTIQEYLNLQYSSSTLTTLPTKISVRD